jgi:hypothetical protein
LTSVFNQIPILAFSFIMVALKVSIPLSPDVEKQSLYSKMRRMDFAGSATLAAAIGCLLLGFSLKSTESLPWSHPLVYGLFIASAIFGTLFIVVEAHWSPYPVMPLYLITQRTPLAVSLSNLFGCMAAFSMVRLRRPMQLLRLTSYIQIYNVPLVCLFWTVKPNLP